IMTSSRKQDKGKAHSSSKNKGKGKAKATPAPTNSRDAIILCVPNMKEYYLTYKKRPLTPKKRFDLAGLGVDFPNINLQLNGKVDDYAKEYPFTELLPIFILTLYIGDNVNT
ncbi:hypothetical protein HAX54_002591, partial [Datura stramonium]|nr:hypothetical protein [Datura stramonium]